MSESRSRSGFNVPVEPLRVHPMSLALAQIGCAGILLAQPVHAATWNAATFDAAADAHVLYLAQAVSDYSKLPGRRPPGVTNAPPPPPPTGMPGGGSGGSPGSRNPGTGPAPGGDSGNQKR